MVFVETVTKDTHATDVYALSGDEPEAITDAAYMLFLHLAFPTHGNPTFSIYIYPLVFLPL